MKNDEIIFVHTNCKTEKNALEISEKLVRDGLVACTNLWKIRSQYIWEDEFVDDEEWRLVAKTKAGFYKEVEKVMKDLHLYDCPFIGSVQLENLYEPYKNWVLGEMENTN